MSVRGTLVLLYHRIAALDRDPYELTVHPDRFAQHCEVLRRRGTVVPFGAAPGTTGHIVITFDDGYADNAGEACRRLGEAGLPATFFIATALVGRRDEIWWDRLEQMFLEREPSADHVEVRIDGTPLWADVRSPAARARAQIALYLRMRALPPDALQALLEDVRSQLGVQSSPRESRRWMSVEELRALAAQPGIEIGAHTVRHPFLASLTPEEQWQEIDGSRDQLERLLERPVDLFSYPFGGHDAFTPVTTRLVRQAGYRMAATGIGGLAPPGGDPLLVQRNVVGDWDAETFDRWIDRRFGLGG